MPTDASVKDLDMLYKETDKLYARIARGCGLSDCAYWVMYAIEVAGGKATQRELAEQLSYSKQTVNSAVRTLEVRGLVELAFAPGSKRSKDVSFTEDGVAFVRERIAPAMDIERQAFASLEPAERVELVRLAMKYARAVDDELARSGFASRGGA